jgi:hypothetical protein
MQIAESSNQHDAELEEFRNLLGPHLASRYTDGQLRQLQREMYQMAELLLDLYLIRRHELKDTSKSPATNT